jgi:hypothetical protein
MKLWMMKVVKYPVVYVLIDIVTCYATEDAVQIVNSFIYNPNHTSLQLQLFLILLKRLHNYNP